MFVLIIALFVLLANMHKIIGYHFLFLNPVLLPLWLWFTLYIWGVALVATIGALYFILIVDDFSQFSWLYPLHTKDQSLFVFLQFNKSCRKPIWHYIKCLNLIVGVSLKPFSSFLANHALNIDCHTLKLHNKMVW